MDNKEDQRENNTGIRSLIKNLDPRKYSLKGKIQVLIIAAVLGSVLLLCIIGFISNKRMAIASSYDKLSTVQEAKKQYVESFFNEIQNHIRVLSQNDVVLKAVTDFKNAFRSVATDDYYSSPSVIESMSKVLTNYYETEYLPEIEDKIEVDLDAEHFLPGDNNGKLLHYLYIVKNNKPPDLKHLMNRSDADASSYGDVHAEYHPFFRNIMNRFRYSDIYLIDNTSGDIIYSVRKKLDFATNLIEDTYSNSGLSRAYKYAAAAVNSDFTIIEDLEHYYPSTLEPELFIASPVYEGTEKRGVLVFRISVSYIDDMLHRAGSDEINDLSKSFRINIVGSDMYLRNNDTRLINDKEGFIKLLKKTKADIGTVNKIDSYSTSALIQNISKELISDAGDGYKGQGIYKDITRDDILCTYTPLNIKGLNWIMVVQADKKELLQSSGNFLFLLIVIGLVLVIISSFAGRLYGRKISYRINKINDALITLSKGEIFDEMTNSQYDELGNTTEAANKIMHRIHEASDFAINLGEGRFEHEFKAYSDNDKLGVSLEKMKHSLVTSRDEENKRKEEDDIRSWTTQGIVKINDILRTDNDNIEKLSYNLIRNLIDYLSANQGSIFIIEGEENKKKYLNLVASYAYDRRKYLAKQIEIGEGLAGNCVLEKRTIYLREIPEDYFEITSGLGKALPRNLLIVPLKLEDEVLGVVEIASFNELKEHEISFVEQVAEGIASTIVTVKLNIRTAQLLEESNKRSEELAQQEEEMRQNLEEMKATQEELRRVKDDEKKAAEKHQKEQEELMNQLRKQNEELNKVQVDLLKETALLNNLMNFSPDYIYFKDKKSKFIRISKTMATQFGYKSPEAAIGKSDFDIFTDEHARPAYNDEMRIIKTGKPIKNKIEKETREGGKISWVTTTKMPLISESGEIIGTFGVSSDITHIKSLEIKMQKNMEEMKATQKELKRVKDDEKKVAEKHQKEQEKLMKKLKIQNEELNKVQVDLLKETALLNNLMNFSPDSIYFKDKKSKFVRISKSMAIRFGFKRPEDSIGKSDFDLFTDEHARPAYNDEMKIIKTGKSIINKIEKETMEDGRINWVNTTKMPLVDEKGKIIGTFGVSSDITPIKELEIRAKKAEQNSKKLIAELKKKEELINKFKKGRK
jgi:PAS domain S-box-containing protein